MKYVLMILTIMLFTGCTKNEPKPITVTVTKTKYIHLPERLVKDDITLPKPPDKKVYINSNPLERESLLTGFIVDLYKTIGEYRIKLKNIRIYDNNITKMTTDQH